jgi:hypothetical protein
MSFVSLDGMYCKYIIILIFILSYIVIYNAFRFIVLIKCLVRSYLVVKSCSLRACCAENSTNDTART